MYDPIEDLVGDAKQGDGTIAFGVLYRLLGFRDRHYQFSSPDFWNFEVAHAERKELKLGVNVKLRVNFPNNNFMPHIAMHFKIKPNF